MDIIIIILTVAIVICIVNVRAIVTGDRMRTRSEVRNELDDLRTAIAAFDAGDNEPSFGLTLMRSGLERRQEALEEGLKDYFACRPQLYDWKKFGE